jgi:hypothetical protein
MYNLYKEFLGELSTLLSHLIWRKNTNVSINWFDRSANPATRDAENSFSVDRFLRLVSRRRNGGRNVTPISLQFVDHRRLRKAQNAVRECRLHSWMLPFASRKARCFSYKVEQRLTARDLRHNSLIGFLIKWTIFIGTWIQEFLLSSVGLILSYSRMTKGFTQPHQNSRIPHFPALFYGLGLKTHCEMFIFTF